MLLFSLPQRNTLLTVILYAAVAPAAGPGTGGALGQTPMGTAPAGGGLPDLGQLAGLGMPDLGSLGSGGLLDPTVMQQMLQNPQIQQMMQGLLSNPQYMNQVLSFLQATV